MDMDIVIKQRCEICGALFIQEYGYSLVGMWAITGHHEGIPAYDCTKQHWGCTPEHAMEAFQHCLAKGELSIETLKSKHAQARNDGKAKVAPYFQELYEQKGENFHIIKEGNNGNNNDTVRGANTDNRRSKPATGN